MSLAVQLRLIHKKINQAAMLSGRKPEDIKIVAVSKKVSVEQMREAHALGINSFAENYVQEALEKKTALEGLNLDWHFIGHIQSNKVKKIAGEFNLIHSVDRIGIAEEISERSSRPQEVLIEVNLAGEKSKSGCSVKNLQEIIDNVQSLDRVRLRGLMFMPPLEQSVAEARNFYVRARELREIYSKRVCTPHSLLELSMGTSHDFEVAIEEGATIVRLGTVLFGQREI